MGEEVEEEDHEQGAEGPTADGGGGQGREEEDEEDHEQGTGGPSADGGEGHGEEEGEEEKEEEKEEEAEEMELLRGNDTSESEMLTSTPLKDNKLTPLEVAEINT